MVVRERRAAEAAGASAGTQCGYILEAGVWQLNFTTPQITSMCHNQYVYWGLPLNIAQSSSHHSA
jgi:hypothetical protein